MTDIIWRWYESEGQETHQMRYEYDSQTVSWVCDECGKHIRIYPDFAILERGDMKVLHRGSIGGLKIETVDITVKDD